MIFEIVFSVLVIADTILTYKVLAKGGYKEKKYWQIFKFKFPTLMGICIDYPALAIAVTIFLSGSLMLFLAYAQCVWVLIFPIIALGFACRKSWMILRDKF